jgi:ABC-2 type transport system permease protein
LSLKQILAVSNRMGKQIIRSKWTIPYLIIFPIFFIGLYWFGFSASPIGENQTFLLGALNQDEGLINSLNQVFQNETIMGNWSLDQYHSSDVVTTGFGSEFIEILSNLSYSDTDDSSKIFDVTLLNDETQANSLLRNRDLDLVVILPPQFSNASIGLLNEYWKTSYGFFFHEYLQSLFPTVPDFPSNFSTTIQIRGDESYLNYQIGKSILTNVIQGYQDLTTILDGPGGSISIQMDKDYLISIPTYSLFGISIPGLIAFGIIIQPSLISLFFCMEFRPRNYTFDRIRLSPSSTSSYILGTLLVQIPVMLIQALILFISSILMGFRPEGDIVLAYFIILTLFPFSASLTYVTTAFLSNEDVVGTILGFGGPFLGFMSGSFIEVPKFVLLANSFPTASGILRDFLIWDLLPLTHTVNALRQVLLYDFNLLMVFPDILMSLLLSLVYFVISIFLFAYFRFRRF